METKTKAVGYVRVSSAVQVDGESLTTQRNQITDFCKQKGWQLQHIYADEGKTGTKLEYRLGLQQMLEDAKAGKFDVVVIWKLSRLFRNARDYQNTVYELDKNNVILASVKENIDPTTKTGKMIAGMISLMAEWEHETIREQMWENKVSVWKDNRAFMGKTPFGYKWNKETKQLEIIEKEAVIYKRIVDMYLKRGMSMHDITIKLNDEKLTVNMYRSKVNGEKHSQRPFSSAVVSYMLKNPVYYGHYIVNKYKYADGAQGAGTKRTKELKPDSEQITFPVPALISKSRWEEIQRTTEFRKVKTKNKGEFTDTFFLRDICTCGVCGGKLSTTVGNKRRDGLRPRYYSCYWSATSKKNLVESRKRTKCTQPYSKADEVEKLVWNQIFVKFGMSGNKAVARLTDTTKQQKELEAKKEALSRLQSDLKAKERAKANIYKLLEMDDLNVDDLHKQLRENNEQIISLTSHITETENAVKEFEEAFANESKLNEIAKSDKVYLTKLLQELKALPLPDKKLLMESWIDGRVTVNHLPDTEDEPGGLEVDFKTSINVDILQRFIDEGKISRLNKNSSYYFNLIGMMV
jgi:site-specific DNA recombinase